ncbi:MAG TPA: hypothetical protein VMN76_01415 [Acidobacteriota bacterium]|nr:hypothetical protein [Acidobacteriota bacterium]
MKQTDCQDALPFHSDRRLTVDFEDGRVSWDTGLMLLHAVDRSHGLEPDPREHEKLCRRE